MRTPLILLPLNEMKNGYDNNKNYAKNRLFFYKFTYVFFKAVMIIPICLTLIGRGFFFLYFKLPFKFIDKSIDFAHTISRGYNYTTPL